MAVTNDKRSPVSLAALTSAALALPGLNMPVRAEVPPASIGVDTQFSRYEESANRMRVDVYQAAATLPIGDRFSLRANGVKDVVTGASPVGPAALGTFGCKGRTRGSLIQCMSGASIRDVRDSVDINGSYYFDDVTVGVDVGRSSENDYTSNFFNIDGRWEINNKMTTLATGYGFASDRVWEFNQRADGSHGKVPGVGGAKENHQGLIGITQILDKNSLLQANLTYSYSGGFLSDPYKYAYAPWAGDPQYGTFVRDQRPGNRHQIGVLLRYVRHFAALNSAALHFDYRFYSDSWNVDSHTVEIGWLQPIVDGWQFEPRIRYYTQTSADFYQPVFDVPRADGHYSSDYRLAGFGAIAGGAQLSKEFFDRLKISGSVDFYDRHKGYGISGGSGTPLDNFSFAMYSVGLNLKF